MRLSEINNLFTQDISLNAFKKQIESEVSNYRESLNKKGSSSPILLNEDLQSVVITEDNIKFLCDAFLRGKFDKWELNYVVEALLLSEKVSSDNDKVEDALLALADPEYFKLVDPEYVRGILEEFTI